MKYLVMLHDLTWIDFSFPDRDIMRHYRTMREAIARAGMRVFTIHELPTEEPA